MDVFHLIIIIVAGVILADLIAHPSGTQVLTNGFNTFWGIITNPTNNGQGFKK